MNKPTKAKSREYQQRYRNSAKGRAWLLRYQKTGKPQARTRAWMKSEKGIAWKRAYYKKWYADPRRRAAHLRSTRQWKTSDIGRASATRWRNSPGPRARLRAKWLSAPYLKHIRAKRDRRILRQQCLRCRKPPVPGKTMCRRHLDYIARWQKQYRERL